MIIADNFVMGHLPKTGGHAFAVMCHEINYKFSNLELPFKIQKKRAKINIEGSLHTLFSDINIANKSIFLTMRRLPYWIYSIMWHQSIHTKMNIKFGCEKDHIRDVYNSEFKDKPCNLPLSEFGCHTVYPDFRLEQFLKGYEIKIIWLRMEHLTEDFIFNLKKHLKIELNKLEIKRLKSLSKIRHSYNTENNVLRYFSQDNINILYENNPIWAKIEKQVYGNTL